MPTFPPTVLTEVPPTRNKSPIVIQENCTWFEARNACRAQGRILAERVELQEGLKAWLGLHRHGLWGYWVWDDDSPMEEDSQKWGEGEPNDPIWGNCGAGVGTEDGVKWENECCGHKLYYVCE
nr:C-type lectin lectoxin-Lio2-like [Anolis sagrei ordinatus]